MNRKQLATFVLTGAIALSLGRMLLDGPPGVDRYTGTAVRVERMAQAPTADAAATDLTKSEGEDVDPLSASWAAAPAAETSAHAAEQVERRPLAVEIRWPEGVEPVEEMIVYAFRRDVPSAYLARMLTSTVNPSESKRASNHDEHSDHRRGAKWIRAAMVAQAPITRVPGAYPPRWIAHLDVPAQGLHVFVHAFGGGAYTVESSEVFRAATTVTLRPRLGGRIELIVRLPEGARGVVLAGTQVKVNAKIEAAIYTPIKFTGAGRFGTAVNLDAGGRVLLGTIPTGIPLDLTLRNDGFVPVHMVIDPLAPGERRGIEIDAVLGQRVIGRVVDSGGRGIGGAQVTGALPPEISALDDDVVAETVTDSDGQFLLEHLPEGAIILRTDADDALQSERVPIEIEAGRGTPPVELTLDAGRTITGVARFQGGETAGGIVIEATFDVAKTGDESGRGARGRTVADGDGTFRLTGLGAGPFSVRASGHPASRAGAHDPTTFCVRVDGVLTGTEDLVLELHPPLGVSGLVVDDAGVPLPGIEVDCARLVAGTLGDTRVQHSSTETDDRGRFETDDLVEGRWVLSVATAAFVTVTDVQIDVYAPVEDARIVVLRTGSISGVVLDSSGLPIEGAVVEQASDQPRWMAWLLSSGPPLRTRCLEDGTFLLLGVPPGAVRLTASTADRSPATSGVIDVAPGTTVEGIALRLMEGGTLKGLCFDDAGDPAAGRIIMVQTTDQSMMCVLLSDEDGAFELHGLAAGSYQLDAMPLAGDTAGEVLGEAGDGDLEDLLENMDTARAEVVEGQTVTVCIGGPLADPLVISGHVDLGGKPYRGAEVVWARAPESGTGGDQRTITDDDGDYGVTLDGAGAYRVHVLRTPMGEGREGRVEFRVVIPEGAKEFERDFTVPSGTIAGRVIGPGSEPVSVARVSIMEVGGMRTDRPFGGSWASPSTSAQGAFEATGLRPGTYQVAAGEWAANANSPTALGHTVVGNFTLGEDERIDGVEIRLSVPGAARVSVFDSAGRAVANATIFLRDANGRHTEFISWKVTDSSGIATVPALAPGRYTVAARTATAASQESAPFGVSAGETGRARVTLEPGGTIIAVLRTKSDTQASSAIIQVLDSAGRDVTRRIGPSDKRSLNSTASFSSRNPLRFGPLPPGRYKVLATTADGRSAKRDVIIDGPGERRVPLVLR